MPSHAGMLSHQPPGLPGRGHRLHLWFGKHPDSGHPPGGPGSPGKDRRRRRPHGAGTAGQRRRVRPGCETDCVVVFLPQERLTSPCGKACACHKQLLENLLGLMSQKAFDLSERVEVLSCRTIREKLLCYFRICAGQNQSLSFTLPFSLSDLADYICSDRSAMMRELKRLREEGFLEISGRNVRFKTGLCAASFPTQ